MKSTRPPLGSGVGSAPRRCEVRFLCVVAVLAALAVGGIAAEPAYADECMGPPGPTSVVMVDATPSEGIDCGGNSSGYEDGYNADDSDDFYYHHRDGNCAVTGVRGVKRNTWWGHTVWRYHQRVSWCWNGNAVTALHRDRFVEVNCCFWQWRGHIGSNCSSEHCNGQTGHYYQEVWTQGHFAHCYTWCSHEQTPGVSMTVTGGGDWWWWRF